LISKDVIVNEEAFNAYLTLHGVTHLHATPTFLERVTLTAGFIRRVASGGEECNRQLADKFYPKYDFYNKYGPTETTVTSLIYKYVRTDTARPTVPIGKPVRNTRVYIMSTSGQLQPLG
ncbi:AMP-binding protein, partial [Fulvivirga imtechensis]|uniref:AMP-binding protein n=1 Tax=Fulvivirga imtechensis TaxID=881893 RepID=UPI00058DF8A9